MDNLHLPLAVDSSPDSGSAGGASSADNHLTSSLQGNIDIVSASDPGAGPSRARGYVFLRDYGSIGLNVPSYPRDREALILPCAAPSTSDDAATSSDPPPFPSLAPYKDVRPVPWAYLKLLLATELVNIRRENKNALSSLEAQARLLQNIVSYIRDELHVHLPCFGTTTIQQLQQILEFDPAFRDAMQRLETDGELAMRTIVHHLIIQPDSSGPPRSADTVCSPEDPQTLGYRDSQIPDSLQSPEAVPKRHRLDGVCSARLTDSTFPPFKPRLFKGHIEENTAKWMNLVWSSGQICRERPATDATVEGLGRVVHAILSRIHVDSPGSTPVFENVSPAQFAALLAGDPAFETAARDLHAKASMPDYLAFCLALRPVVNQLCQKHKGAQKPVLHVRISLPDLE